MNDPISYGFDERLAMSRGVSADKSVTAILLDNIPGALNVHAAHEINDRNGTDYWVEHARGEHLSVDVKVRSKDYKALAGEDDLALETWSVVERDVPGWTRDETKRTDYILWFWSDTGRWCLVPFAMLCAVFQENWREWSRRFKTRRQSTPDRGYQSECVFVERRSVWAAIYRRFG